jgi:hypothetical protein
LIKQVITFKDFDDQEITEVHYFHLSKSELIDMELAEEGGLAAKLQVIGKSGNGAVIMSEFRKIIAAAYGQRVDGSSSKFYKSPQLTDEFMGSLAFDALFTMLLTDVKSASDFINGLMPADLMQLAQVAAASQTADVPAIDKTGVSPEDLAESGLRSPLDENGKVLPWAFREPTATEQMKMTREQLGEVYQRKTRGWKPPVRDVASPS